MEYFLALVALVVMIALIVNIRHKKSDKEYEEYLAELEQVKERKINRKSGRWKKISDHEYGYTGWIDKQPGPFDVN